MDCLSKQPDDRPQSVFALAERLEKVKRIDRWNTEDATRWWEAFAAKDAKQKIRTQTEEEGLHLAG